MNRVAYVGVDVQVNRGCPYAVLDGRLVPQGSGWLASAGEIGEVVTGVLEFFDRVAVGIDAPRCPLEKPRQHYWNGRRQEWRPRRAGERGHGRHCEVVIAAFDMANPQWTPLAGDCPQWMQVGFSLFSALSTCAEVYEVFPAASYRQLAEDRKTQLSISLTDFAPGPRDMLDAYVAAFTVHEFLEGQGTEVGGGDGLGTIVLPRRLPAGRSDVLHWPE